MAKKVGKKKKRKNKPRNRFGFVRHERNLDKLIELKTPVLFSELDEERKSEAIEQLEELVGGFFMGADYIPDDEDRDKILACLCDYMEDSLNRWEPDPYDPTAGLDPRFDFGPEVSFEDRIVRMKEILTEDAENFDPYAELEEPEPTPRKELVADAALIAAYDGIATRILADLEADGITLPTFMENEPGKDVYILEKGG